MQMGPGRRSACPGPFSLSLGVEGTAPAAYLSDVQGVRNRVP